MDLHQLVPQIFSRRESQETGELDPPVEHLLRRQVDLWQQRVPQSPVRAEVVDVADPLADQVLQLGDVVERALLDVLGPAGTIRSLPRLSLVNSTSMSAGLTRRRPPLRVES